jgi:rRNA maturation endonuclease Nob1
LPRLSDVDLDVLALALGLSVELFTDDYRLQNVMKNAGLSTQPVGVKPAKQVWQWQLRCTGCRTTQPVPKDVKTSKQGPVKDCDVCGSPMMLKRAK